MPAVRYVSLVDARAGQRYGDEEAGRLTLENVQADTAELVNVGMVDLGEEADLWRCHGIVVWKEQLEIEYAACNGVSGSRPMRGNSEGC